MGPTTSEGMKRNGRLFRSRPCVRTLDPVLVNCRSGNLLGVRAPEPGWTNGFSANSNFIVQKNT